MNDEIIWFDTLPSPVGDLLMATNASGLVHIGFSEERHSFKRSGQWLRAPERLSEVSGQLNEYFSGHRKQFDLKLIPQGTVFQMQVWAQLREIPFGETISYGELARRIDNPKAMRAVGLANGRNPIPIIVPCHRVIGADGSLTGFGGGIERKRWLLLHETAAGKW